MLTHLTSNHSVVLHFAAESKCMNTQGQWCPINSCISGPALNLLGGMESSMSNWSHSRSRAMAHSNTVLARMLKLLPRHEFEALAQKHELLSNLGYGAQAAFLFD